MTKKEFYLIAVIVIYTYFAIIFQVNIKAFMNSGKEDQPKITFNAFN